MYLYLLICINIYLQVFICINMYLYLFIFIYMYLYVYINGQYIPQYFVFRNSIFLQERFLTQTHTSIQEYI